MEARVARGFAQPASEPVVPVEFETQSLAAELAQNGFDPARPAVFAWLGVVPYLTPAAFRHTVRHVAQCAPGSVLGFDYGLPSHALPADERAGREALAARLAAIGEPFRMFLTLAEAVAEMAGSQECRTSARRS